MANARVILEQRASSLIALQLAGAEEAEEHDVGLVGEEEDRVPEEEAGGRRGVEGEVAEERGGEVW